MARPGSTTCGIDTRTFHDFDSEHTVLMVLGGFLLLRESKVQLFLNIALMSSVFILCVYKVTMAAITIYIATEKAEALRALQLMCIILCGLSMPYIRYISYGSSSEAFQILRNGVFSYTDDEDEKYFIIKKTYVDKIRFLDYWIRKFCLLTAFANTVFMPLFKLVTPEDSSDRRINPYLPLPLYVPFDTSTYLGFSVAFLSDGVCISFVYISLSSLISLYISSALQLIAQVELLNSSLTRIRERVGSIMAERGTNSMFGIPTSDEEKQFQSCLYDCLRENVLHHQAILKLMKCVSPFMEALNYMAIMAISITMAASIMVILEDPSINIALIVSLCNEVFVYLQVCMVSQTITDKSAEIMNSVYSTPWPESSRSFKVLLRVMLANARRPLVLRGMNYDVSLQTFGDMMSAGYKIMNILR